MSTSIQAYSPSKLLSQKPELLGFAELSIFVTNIEIDGLSADQSVECLVRVSNNSTVINRRTQSHKFENRTQWNCEFEFRCGLEWQLEISVIIHDIENESSLTLSTERIPIDGIGNTSQLLYLFDSCVGDVTFTLDYFSNHKSFRCLAVDCTLNSGLPLTVLNELLTVTTHQRSEQTDTDIEIAMDDRNSSNLLVMAIQTVIAYLKPPATLSTLLHDIYSKSLKRSSFSSQSSPSNGHIQQPSPLSTPRLYDPLTNTDTATLSEQDDIMLSMSKMASVARTFLTRLTENLSQSPPVSMELIEKMLAIFNTYVMKPTATDVFTDCSYSDCKNSIQISPRLLDQSSSDYNTLQCSKDSPESKCVYEWKHLVSFCTIAALWLLQQTHLACSLLSEQNALCDINEISQHIDSINDADDSRGTPTNDTAREGEDGDRLTLKELDTIRFGFSLYDRDLSGEIPTGDVYYFLQDMGCEYTSDEMAIILAEINPDHLETVDFEDFIRWWCEE